MAESRRLASPGNGDPLPVKSTSEAKPSAKPVKKAKVQFYYASIYPGPRTPVPEKFGKLIRRLEAKLRMPVWLLIQDGASQEEYHTIDFHVFKGFQRERQFIREKQPAAILLETPGGNAHYAYYIARFFQRRTRQFLTIVPQYAKSAGTLLTLGGSHVLLGRDAEIGPLDVQILDRDREDFNSALDAVQSLEQLNSFALTAIDETLSFLKFTTKKRTDMLLPHVVTYVANLVRPLIEKIDTVDYSRKSRDLKVAEEYARRLMQPNYPDELAREIAGRLVEKYPSHDFVVDEEEAVSLVPVKDMAFGLKIRERKADEQKILDDLIPYLDGTNFVGRLGEVTR